MQSLFYGCSVGLMASLACFVSLAGADETEALNKLRLGLDYMTDGRWQQAVELLQYCLDLDDAVVVTVKGANGKPMKASAHAEAEKIMALHQDARPAYEKNYGRAARDLLAKAGDKDEKLLGEVSRRFLFTQSGAIAAEKLVVLNFEAGRYAEAAKHSVRLAQSTGLRKISPPTLFKAARAFHLEGDTPNRERFWRKLREQAPKGFQLGDRLWTLQEAEKELKKPAPK